MISKRHGNKGNDTLFLCEHLPEKTETGLLAFDIQQGSTGLLVREKLLKDNTNEKKS